MHSQGGGGILLGESRFIFIVKLVSDSVKKSIWLTNMKTAGIHFHLRHDVFTAKRLFDLTSESETGFAVNVESIFNKRIIPQTAMSSAVYSDCQILILRCHCVGMCYILHLHWNSLTKTQERNILTIYYWLQVYTRSVTFNKNHSSVWLLIHNAWNKSVITLQLSLFCNFEFTLVFSSQLSSVNTLYTRVPKYCIQYHIYC